VIYDHLGQEGAVPPDLIRQLPSCYSEAFDACVGELEKKTPADRLSPYCRQFHAVYAATPGAVWDAAMESMNYCPAPAAEKSKSAPLWLLGAGAAGLLLGVMIR
jgi:hypothetical protein